MALSLTFRSRLQNVTRKAITIQPVRSRWKPVKVDDLTYPTYAERLASWKSRYVDPASQGINIGFHYKSSGDSDHNLEKLKKWTVKRKELEQAARLRTLKIDKNAVQEEWLTESMPEHLRKVGTHYGVFRDMFDGAHFYPIVPLEVFFDYDEELVTPVYFGNVIPPAEASVKPFVSYESKDDSLWTLVMTSPDGNLGDSSQEVLHWFVGNIPGSMVEKGDSICDYLRPFPPKGVGFLRYVFVLYKQKQALDFKEWQRPTGCVSLKDRSFNTLDFYHKNEDSLTPAGLSFFQSQWDKSVTSVFHHVLDMKEPVFDFIRPPPYLPEQEAYPIRQSFNFYLDKYRDIKDIQEEVLKEKLKLVDISKPYIRPRYPCIDLVPKETPSWLRSKIHYQRSGKQQWKYLYEDFE
jgi:large subunit ribosomal protein L38